MNAPERKPRYALRPWQVKYAAWLAEADSPSKALQTQVASELAGAPVKYGRQRYLRQREDFSELLQTMRQGGIEAARNLFVSDLPAYAELFRWGAEHAKAKGDHRGLATYAVAAADRILPKREAFDIAALNQTIIVTMTEKQFAHERAGPTEITATRYDAASDSWVPANDGKRSDPLPLPDAESPAPRKALPPGLQTPAEAFDAARRRDAGRTRNPDPFA